MTDFQEANADDLALAERQIKEYMQSFELGRDQAILLLDDYDRQLVRRLENLQLLHVMAKRAPRVLTAAPSGGYETVIKGVKITLETVSVEGEQHHILRADDRVIDASKDDLADMLEFHALSIATE